MTLVRLFDRPDFDLITREFDRAFEIFRKLENGKPSRREVVSWYPHVDVAELEDRFVLTAELPGVENDDINVEFEDGVLRISGERKAETPKDGNYLHNERFYGKFVRTFTVNTPVDADKIEATFKNGLLTLVIPKAEEAKPKHIKIK